MLRRAGLLEGIDRGKYYAVIQHNEPAKKIPGGRSLIISYYDGRTYLCTKHELRDSEGKCVHQDVEDVFIDGVRYNRLSGPGR